MAARAIRVFTRAADDGGTWLGVDVCYQCEPDPGDSPRKTFSAGEPCPRCASPGQLEWRWSAEPLFPARGP